jgi:CheY-like chemotaxis protein
MRPAILDLSPLLENLEDILGHAVGASVDFVTEFAPDLPPVNADSGMLEQVAMNLSVNARDAMPDGGTLGLRTFAVDLESGPGPNLPGGLYVCLEVTDTGEGMTPDVVARAFDPFFSTKPRGSGTGLGLATVYGIATRFHGHVAIASAPGQGTRVTVYLPAASHSDALAAAEPPSEGSDSAVNGTILLVEDDPGVRRVAERILAERGYTVVSAACAADALDLIEARGGPPDLLLTDIVMPGQSGPSLAAALQQDYPGLPVVFASGYTDKPSELPEGSHFVSKPFDRAELIAGVSKAWRHGSLV